ncbi:MAG: phosphate ABC transporter ATP-binding protein [Chitinophagales bacterium]
MLVFELHEVSKTYNNKTVLNLPSLSFNKDHIHAIIGPNGAGKTTLLRLLNLIDRSDTGYIKFMGARVTGTENERIAMSRDMCMVFQRPYMFRTSVYNNVAYGLKVRGLSSKNIRKQVVEALEFVGMQDYINRLAYQISGGEMQRVALARALALNPKVLLLDEPTANLDPTSVQVIENIIRACRDQYGTSVIVVTHNLFQAKRLADETLLLYAGELVEQRPTEEFFSFPRDNRTRQFLDGTMVY